MKNIKKILFTLLIMVVFTILSSCSINIDNPNINVDEPEITEYTVSFVVNSDNITTKEIKYEKGKKLSEDDIKKDVFENKIPTKTGYTMENWYSDKDYSTSVGLPTIVSQDTTLYLKWVKNTVSLSYYVDNKLKETITIDEGEILTDIYTPTKNGYTFDGWYTDNTYTTKFNFNNKLTANTSVYGKFVQNSSDEPITTYTLNYYLDGSLHHTDTVLSNLNTVAIANPSKENHTFDGWYTDNTYTTKFTFGSKLTANTNVYGKFVPITTYSLNYYVDGSLHQTASFASNVNTTAITTPTKTGYTFDGWYTTNTYTTRFTFGNKLTTNTNIYGKFDINTYKVEFYDGSTLLATQQVEYNDYAEELLSTDTNKENYTFVGWCTDSACTNQISLSTYKITQATKLYAKYTLDNIDSLSLNVTAFSGYNEGAYIEFDRTEGVDLSNYEVYYQKSGASTPTKIDSELIRENTTTIRADILGLTQGTYTITIKLTGTDVSEEKSVTVYQADRSGYAHFVADTDAIGAYNEDGSLKSNADVIYVSNETKNTVTYGSYTGLVQILSNANKFTNPVVIRILDKISTNQWKAKSDAPRIYESGNNYGTNYTEATFNSYITNELETTYGDNLVGLTNKIMIQQELKQITYSYTTTQTGLSSVSKTEKTLEEDATTSYNRNDFSEAKGKTVYDDDSYFNMLDISESTKGLTLEGVGSSAEIFQWGMTFKKCTNVEIKNLTFTSAPEDACSIEGNKDSVANYKNYWIHNNTFNRGLNNWDLTGEKDKYAGDGAMDLKYCQGVTASYNKFNNCKKTGLVGGGDSNIQYNITFHHNYYNQVESRLPLGRQANMHMYNNYYYDCDVTVDIRANAYAFLEANYFENSQKPRTTVKSDNGYYPFVKSYNDVYDSCSDPASNYGTAFIASSRDSYPDTYDSTVNGCNINGTSYLKFDTDSTLFYYNTSTKKSNVTYLTDAATAKTDCISNSGVLSGTFVGNGSGSSSGGSTGGSTGGESGGSSTPITGSTTITFNNFTTETLSTTTTLNGITLIKNTKTVAVQEFSEAKTINGQAINKYVSFGGGASYTDGCVQFTTTATANITVYYASGGSSERFAAIFNDTEGKLDEATTPTVIKDANTIVSYTFNNIEAGNLAIGSSSSGINIVAIVIEYI
ncbi:MAG: hypothetical protein E7176_00165 [Erysipelotrichaceae bacterium]|nr:hypothetical protein [Erysipelotrichaceae bacterium]